MKKCSGILILLFWNIISSSGQFYNYRFINYNADNGLIENENRVVYQDRTGLIWIGSVNGLIRFDGRNFVVFKNDPENPNSISNNMVKAILEDENKQLWIGTEDGLNLYDALKNSFVVFKSQKADTTTISNNNINFLYLDPLGNFWVCTEDGLNLKGKDNNTFKRYIRKDEKDPIFPGENIERIFFAGENLYWLATNKGLGLFDPVKKTSGKYEFNNLKMTDIDNYWIDDVIVDKKNRLWVGVSSGGLFRIDNPEKFSCIHYVHDPKKPNSLLDNDIRRIFEDSEGNIWIGSYEGLHLYKEVDDGFIRFVHDDLNEYSIGGSNVFSVFEDRQNNLWIPTKRGVSFYSKYQNQFQLIRNVSNRSQASLSNEVTAICKSQENELWVGYILRGLDYYKDGKLVQHYESTSGNSNSLINNNVRSLLKDNDILWIGTLGGLSRLDIKTKSIRNFVSVSGDPSSLGNNWVLSVQKDSKGRIWCCTWGGGLNLYNPDSRNFKRFLTGKDQNEADAFVKTILENDDGSFWIGNNDGLKLFHPEMGIIKRYKHIFGDKTSLSGNYVQSICRDSNGRLWIGTTTGLNLLKDLEKGYFINYTEREGLPSNIIYGIVEDKNHHLWLSTSNGLSCIDASFASDSISIRNYYKEDGLQGNQFNEGAFFSYNYGKEMFFGGTNGISFFQPDKVTDNPFKPDVFFSKLLLSNQTVISGISGSPLSVELDYSKELKFKYSQSSAITIEFSALNFINPGKNKYAYVLEGFDKDWIYAGEKNSITYTNLSPGRYTLKIKASNNHGIWNDNPRLMKIVIRPPWWRTIWALIGYVFIINGILLLLRHYSLSQAKLKHSLAIEKVEKEKSVELNDLKLKFFTNISHEFKTPLTLIMAPADELLKDTVLSENSKKHVSIIKRNAQRLSRLINQLLEFRRVESGNWELNILEFDVIKEIKNIQSAFEDYANKYSISFFIETKLSELKIFADPDKFEKIIYNLLSNAFKYTPEHGTVRVIIEKINTTEENNAGFLSSLVHSSKSEIMDSEFVRITIEDTGIGIENKELLRIFNPYYSGMGNHTPFILKETSTGIGLAYAKSLVELHQGTLAVESEMGVGTRFSVHLPVRNKNFSKELVPTDSQISEKHDESFELLKFEEDSKVIPFQTSNSFSKYESKQKHLILVVEDIRDMREFIRDGLSETYNVLEAINGQDAFELAQKMMPDLIVTDVMMPVMDGLEFCRLIKSEVKTSHIPVVMLTAKTQVHDAIEGYELGADEYIGKPFSIDLLITRIRNIIEAKRRLREFYSKGTIDQSSPELKLSRIDENFLKSAFEVVENHLSDPDLDVDVFCDALKMSQMQVYRKLKSLVNQSTNEFIRNYRLDKAAKLLQENDLNVSEVAYTVGFSDPLYFSRSFKKKFGVSPIYYHKKFK